jgi:hypothetical protein
MDDIKIVTRTCITCEHEPKWKPGSPTSPRHWGECRAGWHFSTKEVALQGQVAFFEKEPITDCPAWALK